MLLFTSCNYLILFYYFSSQQKQTATQQQQQLHTRVRSDVSVSICVQSVGESGCLETVGQMLASSASGVTLMFIPINR